MFTTRKGLLAVILLALLWSGGWHFSDILPSKPSPDIRLSERALNHILSGDNRGGGHKFGAGKPCKSEFPQSWDGKAIHDRIMRVASNDDVTWHKQKNGYYVSEKMIEGVNMRVVIDREKDDIVTAYPTNTNRNACPPRTPANDNGN